MSALILSGISFKSEGIFLGISPFLCPPCELPRVSLLATYGVTPLREA